MIQIETAVDVGSYRKTFEKAEKDARVIFS